MRSTAALALDETVWQPVAHVAVRDEDLRTRLTETLHRCSWAAVTSPTGYHLLQTLSGPLFGEQPWLRPALIVVDAFSPGCSGLTIAHGLRDLGWSIPVVLVAASEEHRALLEDSQDHQLFVTERDVAVPTVMALARRRSSRESRPS